MVGLGKEPAVDFCLFGVGVLLWEGVMLLVQSS